MSTMVSRTPDLKPTTSTFVTIWLYRMQNRLQQIRLPMERPGLKRKSNQAKAFVVLAVTVMAASAGTGAGAGVGAIGIGVGVVMAS